jgi:C-7 ketoreductase
VRVAIVTGAGTGIGAAAARLLAADGCAVALVGRREQPLARLAAELDHAHVVVSDLAEPSAPEQVVRAVLSVFDRLDVLVNNAAVIHNGPFESFSRAEFDRHVAVNLRAPFFLAQAALPALRRGEFPAVVNVSSSVGSLVKPGTTLYAVTKAGLEYLTRANAYEFAQWGVRVNCVAPGPVETPIHATYMDDVEAGYRDLSRLIPLGRMGRVEDIAHWIRWLASPTTEWTTGTVIHVDGGQVLGRPEEMGG